MKDSYKGLIGTIIVIVISFIAFTSGYLENEIISDISGLKEEIIDLQNDLDLVESKSQSILNKEIDIFIESKQIFLETQILSDELFLLQSEISNSEKMAYLNRISKLLIESQERMNNLLTVRLYYWFEYYSITTPFVISEAVGEFSEFEITKTRWDAYQPFPAIVNVFNSFEYYGFTGFYDNISADYTVYNRYIEISDQEEVFVRAIEVLQLEKHIDALLFAQTRELKTEINQKVKSINMMEKELSQVSSGVSIITIAIILSAAMVARLSDQSLEKDFDKIKELVSQEQIIDAKKRDYISMPVLILALLISIASLFIPLLLILT